MSKFQDPKSLELLKVAADDADALHALLYQFQNNGDDTCDQHSQELLMMADDLRSKILEHIERRSEEVQ